MAITGINEELKEKTLNSILAYFRKRQTKVDTYYENKKIISMQDDIHRHFHEYNLTPEKTDK